MDTDQTKSIVLRYFRSWQQPSDFDEMRACVADDLVFDTGMQTIEGRRV